MLAKLFRRDALSKVAKKGRGLAARATRPSYVSVGAQCVIDPTVRFTILDGEIRIGDRVEIYQGAWLQAPIQIGDGTFINRDAAIRPRTTIGKNVSIGPFVQLVTDWHEISNTTRRAGPVSWKPIVVKDGVWIGAGAIILGGVTLGRGCIVGAGSVVSRDVEPDTLVLGNPARHVRSLEPLID